MKKILTFILLIYSYLTINAQVSFEKGYFINNDDEKIECLIKNLDLLNNPKDFTYKLSETSKPYEATIHNVKIFEIYDIVKYERHIVDIDRSSELNDEISATRKAEFNKEKLFLKVLIEGKATLYHYAETNLSRFFYKNTNSNLEQLVYKSYRENFDFDIKKNQRYKQQLMNTLNCSNFKKTKFTNLNYKKNSLVNFFIDYNNCVDSSYKNYTAKTGKSSNSYFSLSFKAGVNFASPFLKNGLVLIRSIDFEDKIIPRLSLELEYVFGFNNNKWAFVLDPSYNANYSSFGEDTVGRRTDIDYSSIEISSGLRHYMFLNKKSKLFLNAFFVNDIPINSSVVGENELDLSYSLSYAYGAGYEYKNRFSVEIRLFTTRNTSSNFVFLDTLFNNTAIILGYTIF